MKDSYKIFFDNGYMSKKDFFNFGLNETIFSSYEKAEIDWKNLKNIIYGNQEVYIRGFGRDAAGTHLFLNFYRHLINNNKVKKDPTNNQEPSKKIKFLTGYSKTKNKNFKLIRNYQVSHVFGRTKNVFAFNAPWNIVYMPKILDPFTGHEASGELVDEYSSLFQHKIYNYFRPLIEDYNTIVNNQSFSAKIIDSINLTLLNAKLSGKEAERFKLTVQVEFLPISLSEI